MSVTFEISLPFKTVLAMRDIKDELATTTKGTVNTEIEDFLAADAWRIVAKAAKGLDSDIIPAKESDAYSEEYCSCDDDVKYGVAYSKANGDHEPYNVTVPIFDCPDSLHWSAKDNWETSELLKVTIQDAMRKEKRFEVEDSTTFAQLTQAYAQRIDSPMWSLTFKYNGRVIHNESLCTLKDLSIHSHSVIEVRPSIDDVVHKHITVTLQDETAKYEDLRCAVSDQACVCDLGVLWTKHTDEDPNDFYFEVDGVSWFTTDEETMQELNIGHGDVVCVKSKEVADADCDWGAVDADMEARQRCSSPASVRSSDANNWGARTVSNAGSCGLHRTPSGFFVVPPTTSAGWTAPPPTLAHGGWVSGNKASSDYWAIPPTPASIGGTHPPHALVQGGWMPHSRWGSDKGSVQTVSLHSDSEWAQNTPSTSPGGAASFIDDADQSSVTSEPIACAGSLTIHVNVPKGDRVLVVTHSQDTLEEFWDLLYRQAGSAVLGCSELRFIDGVHVMEEPSSMQRSLSELGVSARTVLEASRPDW
ncbi:hypothetical protein BDY17DRAFT_302132 [Neohortaea acidophila]|uniref:Ubiquitin-like domain-containing protein n=1 Tax=Neohortaea acidophila TaxID=245834 RepID=A0A6A6PMG1_9PEZI|nr:uncharacterized protein BDY17DRAFT_302132 [Neohortaea acidophila]KAF2480643.1 hypothetical protein BDY17DRAFT_302132 [Neohortaea acidophila]